jgi:hypothetical protein
MKKLTKAQIAGILIDDPRQPIHTRYSTPERGKIITANWHSFSGIKPRDIKRQWHMFDAFNNMETEISAGWIVDLCTARGHWGPFTKLDIEKLYRKHYQDGFTFNRLVEPGLRYSMPGESARLTGGGWLVIFNGKYHLTENFIMRCFASSCKG